MNKELTFKIYDDRGIRRIAVSYKINGKIRGHNIPLEVWKNKLDRLK